MNRLSKSSHFLRNRPRWFVPVLVSAVLALATALYEERTSAIQARVFSAMAARLSFKIATGPSPRIVFPQSGPLNETRGYSNIPAFSRRLVDHQFHIVAQSIFSTELDHVARWGLTPPYREPMSAGLVIRDDNGAILYDARSKEQMFADFDDIPSLVVSSLLFVENRELDEIDANTHNPVVDWGRSAKAAVFYVGHRIGLPVPMEGGSTLATQIEKYRYSEDGRTHSATDKLLQMVSASIRVYQHGSDTRPQRRQIILDYINSAPLSAAPGYGEVYGVGEGLYAWFGMDLAKVRSAFSKSGATAAREKAFKYVLALLCATRAPSYYLMRNRGALNDRVDFYLHQLAAVDIISDGFADGVRRVPLDFLTRAPSPAPEPYVERKATNVIRTWLMQMLAVPNLYSLDRLDLATETTLDVRFQTEVVKLFEKLKDPSFIASHGLAETHLLARGNPADVTYSFSLFERTPMGNALRVQVDTLNAPFDINDGMKMELGSTAKLRTLAHYLELVTGLYTQLHPLPSEVLAKDLRLVRDPITQWVAQTINNEPGIGLAQLLQDALDRRYSGNPAEVFFTGGGAHVFANFETSEGSQNFTLREGLQKSVNLVYVRLMRDLVRFHEDRLPYDPDLVLNDPANPDRLGMLQEIADDESKRILSAAYEDYRGLAPDEIIDRLLGTEQTSARKLALLYLSWNPGATTEGLHVWLASHGADQRLAAHLFKSYDQSRLTLEDYGYLLNLRPLEVWCAGQLFRNPDISWADLMPRSADARKQSSQWFFRTRNRRAQDLRLRTRIEEDAFKRMLPYWQRLGFPFDHLVPSLATAIGSSADRPSALAELIGIISNDGLRLPMLRVHNLHFANDTPYETEFAPNPPAAQKVMNLLVARALHDVLITVVQGGTAIRLKNAFVTSNGTPIPVGGKTGSGDNRYKTFGRGGNVTSARATSRTATFVFYVGDRYFGALTAYVAGEEADGYVFTSALPVAVLKMLAPDIDSQYAGPPKPKILAIAETGAPLSSSERDSPGKTGHPRTQ
jgi:membrane peptidoglycan carboxypeptidase